MASIELLGVTKQFGETRAVDNVSLSIPNGELFFLLGPSGCGKTTLLRMLAGFVTPDSGSISIDGRDVSAVPPHERNTTLVFQSYALWPHMTVLENVRFGLELKKLSAAVIKERLEWVFEMTRISALTSRYPSQLSGGQQQRVALARAVALQSGVILLDEPLSNLDLRLRQELRAELRELHEKLRTTMVYVTHDQEEALVLADRVAVMREGRIEQQGSPREVYDTPTTSFIANFIGESNIFEVVAPCEGERVTTLLGDFQIPTASREDWERPLLTIRPERVVVSEEPGSGGLSFSAELVSVTFHGAVERRSWRVTTSKGASVSVVTSGTSSSPPPTIGSRRWLTFPTHLLRLVDR